MNKKKKTIQAFFKSICLFAVLFLVTLLLLDIPGLYYAQKDKALFEEVSITDYSVSTTEKKMTLDQEIQTLESDDALITTEENSFCSEDQTREACTRLIPELRQLLPDYWYAFFESALSQDPSVILAKAQLYRVIDNTICSFPLGVLRFVGKDSGDPVLALGRGCVLFDAESYSILGLEASLYFDYDEDISRAEEYYYKSYSYEEAETQYKNYYDGCTVADFSSMASGDNPYYIGLIPVPSHAYSDALLSDLNDKMDYLFNISDGELEKYGVDSSTDSIYEEY